MIGKICIMPFQYFDNSIGKMKFKSRPALIIGQADPDDLFVFPVSKVSIKENIHPVYDYKIDPSIYQKTNLNCVSYIRTHKGTVIHKNQVTQIISDFKSDYPEDFVNVMTLYETFTKSIIDNSL